MQIDRVLRLYSVKKEMTIPDLFPKEPQTLENFHRLANLGSSKNLQIVDSLAAENNKRLREFFCEAMKVDKAILSKDTLSASRTISVMFKEFGYSHFLLRKAVLLRTINTTTGNNLLEVEELLSLAGFDNNNIFVTSLIHCYKEEQDFLSLKKSIMNLSKRGAANRFTRDICRLAFHPLAKDEDDLTELLQSSLQSSLIDAVIVAKINIHLVIKLMREKSNLFTLFEYIDLNSVTIEDIASLYPSDDSESEAIFYKHTSAWLENCDIVKYRTLIDHFYDFPESDYFEINEELIKRVGEWVKPIQLCQLSQAQSFNQYNSPKFNLLEVNGNITRSAMFNYCIHIKQGHLKLDEPDLIVLMGQTRDLAKTINPQFLSQLAQLTDSKLSQLILYLLIAKKSKNEFYDHRLRRVFQDIVNQNYGGSIVDLLEALSVHSNAISQYTYEITTEDFIAKLFHIIKNTSEITETRASIHKWMGQKTGETAYLNRARTLLIDHQLNKIRNEIDDNRIYVDSARFVEWINDEVMRDVYGVLTSIEHKNELHEADDPQLMLLVEQCYICFFSNKIFGIASYLGRRIRHGTFKGHLYSSVVKIERTEKYSVLLKNPNIAFKWSRWKLDYEAKIDDIIRNRLHIESNDKRHGLLKPSLNTTEKQEVLSHCAKYIARTFAESKTSDLTPSIINEYCWKLAEFDLKNVNAFLKNQKISLTNKDLLSELKNTANGNLQPLAIEFCRELVRSIDEKLMSMYNWFKRPVNVSPRALLSLLYKAVVAEVKEAFPDFETDTEVEPDEDIDLIGSAYLVLYDAFYVIVYNAAKHGKLNEPILRSFKIVNDKKKSEQKILSLEITSSIKDEDSEELINSRLLVKPDDDINDAQISEDRSGIRKLHHLAQSNKDFSIVAISCKERKVTVTLAHALVA